MAPESVREVISVAQGLAQEGGLNAIRLRPLLEAAGISRRAFYRQFESMDHVLLGLFAETITQAAARFRERIANTPDPLEKLEIVLRCMATYQLDTEDREYRLSLTRDHARLAEEHPLELRVATAPIDDLIQEILEQGMREGKVREGDAKELANIIHLLVSGVVHRNIHLARDGQGWIDELWDFCLNAVRA